MDCTAKKSNCDWPLCLIVGINEENKSIILAQALLVYETEELFEWFLKRLISINDALFLPRVIFTDESKAEIGAIKKVLPNVKDFRCDWHFWKDIIKKLSSSHLNESVTTTISTMFKNAWYSKSEQRFNDAWNEFIRYLNTIDNNSILKYFEHQLSTKNRWAHYYRTPELTLKANSTQRVEIVNSLIQRCCNGKSTVQHLVNRLEQISTDAEDSTANTDFSKVNKVLIENSRRFLNNKKGVDLILDECVKHLSKYAINRLLNELNAAHLYIAAETIDSNYKFQVKLRDDIMQDDENYWKSFTVIWSSGTLNCVCDIFCQLGLVCRHCFAVMFKCQTISAPFHIDTINKRWLNTSEKMIGIPSNYMYVTNNEIKLQYEVDDDILNSFDDDNDHPSTIIMSPQSKQIKEKVAENNNINRSIAARQEVKVKTFLQCKAMAEKLIKQQLDDFHPENVLQLWTNFINESNQKSITALSQSSTIRKRSRSDKNNDATPSQLSNGSFRVAGKGVGTGAAKATRTKIVRNVV